MSNTRYVDKIIAKKNEKKYGKLYFNIDNREEYIEFKNKMEARKWGLNYYDAWSNKYKETMRNARIANNGCFYKPIECYCGYSYLKINNYLRYGSDNINDNYRELANILSIIVCSAPKIPFDVILYRMVNDEFIEKLIEKNKMEIPTPIKETGFMSTSLIKDIVNQSEPYASEKNLLKIYVKKETIGVYVNSVIMRNEEKILIMPNMFLGLIAYPYRDDESGKLVYECELINFC